MTHHRWTLLAILTGAMLFTSACGILGTLFGSSTSSGTVSELWSDVPRMDGMTKADLQMPVAGRIALQAITRDRFDFISFTTAQTPAAVQEYYTEARMEQAGWDSSDTRGCAGDTGDSSVGAICIFGKDSTGKREILGVIIAKDDATPQTQVFFARIVTSEAQSQ